MLNRRRKQQTPTFLEGTPGLYVRRESPPRVPSTAPIPNRGDVTLRGVGANATCANASRSLSGSRSSLAPANSAALTSFKPSAPQPQPPSAGVSMPTLYASAASITIAPSTTAPQQRGNNNARRGRLAARHELSSHSFNNPPSTSWAGRTIGVMTTGAANTTAAVRSPCADQQQAGVRKNSSADASENPALKYDYNNRKRNLATSLSFGNVVESLREIDGGTPYGAIPPATTGRFGEHFLPRQKSITSSCNSAIIASHYALGAGGKVKATRGSSSASLQSLPGSSILRDQSIILPCSSSRTMKFAGSNSIQMVSLVSLDTAGPMSNGVDNNMADDDPEAELELPPNWEVEVTPDGIRYYVDHDHRRTHWIHPLAAENLSPGWIKIFDPIHGVVYYNEVEKRSQFEHPGLATPDIQFHSQAQHLQPTYQQHPHSSQQMIAQNSSNIRNNNDAAGPPSAHYAAQKCVEDLNIIDDKDVPEWIRLYSEAPFESDHLLDWTMFDAAQLEEFDQMLMKLFKQDAINTVIKYERPRREINDALMARNVLIS